MNITIEIDDALKPALELIPHANEIAKNAAEEALRIQMLEIEYKDRIPDKETLEAFNEPSEKMKSFDNLESLIKDLGI